MKKSLFVKSAFACVLLCAAGVALAQIADSPLNVTTENGAAHLYPTPEYARQLGLGKLPAGALIYHAGGKVMTTQTTYVIFWLPAKLQNGGPTGMSAKYQPVVKSFMTDYPSHGINTNSTQYYQTIGTTTTYIKGTGSFGGSFVDNNPYPASGCSDSFTPGNCLTDAQIQAEITRVIGVKGWKASPSHMFLIFTSSGEGSCFDSTSTTCAYTNYCAYHGFYSLGANTVIYGNEPYEEPSVCFNPPSQQSPNGDIFADGVVSVASHEMTEAATDPELNAWFTSGGEEIGDLCNFDFGTNTWDGGLANQMWNGHFYDVQREYDNHSSACV